MFKSITFEIIGEQQLHCESCEQRVERLLKGVQGVGQVRAQAKNQRIEVLFDTAVLDAKAIAERLGEAGYEIRLGGSTSNSGKRDEITESGPLADIELFVPDMVCERCAEKIATALNSLPGVRKVKPKVEQKHVYVLYEPGQIQEKQIKEAIAKAGFSAIEA